MCVFRKLSYSHDLRFTNHSRARGGLLGGTAIKALSGLEHTSLIGKLDEMVKEREDLSALVDKAWETVDNLARTGQSLHPELPGLPTEWELPSLPWEMISLPELPADRVEHASMLGMLDEAAKGTLDLSALLGRARDAQDALRIQAASALENAGQGYWEMPEMPALDLPDLEMPQFSMDSMLQVCDIKIPVLHSTSE
jgi:hypothetical protein